MKILGITAAPRRDSRQERKAKSSRATERGIAGHQAAMRALGSSPLNRSIGSITSSVSVIPEEVGGKKRIKSLSKAGSHTYSNEPEENLTLKQKARRLLEKDVNNGN